MNGVVIWHYDPLGVKVTVPTTSSCRGDQNPTTNTLYKSSIRFKTVDSHARLIQCVGNMARTQKQNNQNVNEMNFNIICDMNEGPFNLQVSKWDNHV
jgi:hypothetical protein